MVSRAKFVRENLIKPDGTPATDDEFEKTIDEEAQIQAPNLSSSQTSLASKTGTDVAKTPKAKQSEDPKQSKTAKKKEKNDVKISSEAPEQIVETTVVVEEVATNRPPTPPKPKTLLRSFDVTPFLMYNC